MPSIQPLKHVPQSAVDFGVTIDNVDLENLTGIDHCQHIVRPQLND